MRTRGGEKVVNIEQSTHIVCKDVWGNHSFTCVFACVECVGVGSGWVVLGGGMQRGLRV